MLPHQIEMIQSIVLKEVTDGIWITTTYDWDEKSKKYKKVYEDMDGVGSRYLECGECGYEYPSHTVDMFDSMDIEHKKE